MPQTSSEYFTKMSQKTLTFLKGFLTIGIFGTVFIAHTAFAQISLTVKSPDPYTGNQSWFVYERNAGEIIEDVATIKNFSDKEKVINIYAVDATSNDSGSFILKFKTEDQKSIGIWTEIEQTSLVLKPGERMDIPFKIHIQREASPSQYIGGIIVENGGEKNGALTETCEPNEDQICKTNVTVKTRIGARIYLTIPGETKEDVAWTGFWQVQKLSGKPSFKFRIENHGNVAYEPKALIEIFDSAGNLYDAFEKPLGDSLPNTDIEPIISWEKEQPLFGKFTAKASVTFPQRFKAGNAELHGASENKQVNFWIVPWLSILLFAAILGSIALAIHRQKSQLKKLRALSQEYEVQDQEDVISIAQHNGLHWKKLAKINNLQAPYILKKGDKILVPPRTK